MGTEETTEVSDLHPLPEQGNRACLVLIQSADGIPGERFDIGVTPLRIGRGTLNEVNLHDTHASRRHARIERLGESVILRDLGSSTGTWLNGVRVEGTVSLAHDSTIKIGATVLKYLNASDLDTAFFDQIYKLSTTDHGTQLFNKDYYLRELERECSRAHRHGGPLSLLVLDLDHFKAVNDGHGHDAGDHALRVVADTIKGCVRKENVVARYGGEELVVLLGDTPLEEAAGVAERIRGAIEQATIMTRQHVFQVTVSIGCAQWKTGDDHGASLFSRADEKMYEAKRAGRNRVVW